MVGVLKALLCVGGLCVTSQYRDGFKVAWQNDEGISSSVIELCRAEHVPASFSELASWSFASVTNTKAVLDRSINDTFSSVWPGLEGEIIGAVKSTNGLIQVGTTTAKGYLRIVDVPSGAEDVLFRARIHKINEGPKRVVVSCIDSTGATNATSKIYLTDEVCEYMAPVTNARSVVFSASAKDYPPQFSEIRLIADYRPAYFATNSISRTEAGLRNTWLFHHLSPDDYFCRVESFCSDGTRSNSSPFLFVSLSPEDPPIPVGFTIRVR